MLSFSHPALSNLRAGAEQRVDHLKWGSAKQGRKGRVTEGGVRTWWRGCAQAPRSRSEENSSSWGSVDTTGPESGGWDGPEGRVSEGLWLAVVRNSSPLQKLQGQRCPRGLARFPLEQGGQNTGPDQTWLFYK